MQRHFATSAGPAVVELARLPMFAVSVQVTRFDGDGWEAGRQSWVEAPAHESLAEFLATSLDVPDDEAEALAADLLDAWLPEADRRGLVETAKSVRRLTFAMVAVGALVVALALLGLVLAVWLLVR